ncbi:regulatory protein GemA [Phenylobacterium sp.]|uniref:regulatory protein GemA n=1 Tax=Phenylobacterium sp. TaxID=1871053 RepID=UPI003926A042
MTAAARQQVSAGRRAMLAKVHLAAKELGLADDARRDVLERIAGARSSADCTDDQLDAVLREFRRLGWTPSKAAPGKHPRARGARKPAPASHPVALKARAMWLSLWNLGVVRQGTETALEAFAARQLGVDRLQWADQAQGYRLIEALKAMAERAGWSQELSALVKPERRLWALKARLVQRQAEILGRPPLQLHDTTEADLDRLARELGPQVRAYKALCE